MNKKKSNGYQLISARSRLNSESSMIGLLKGSLQVAKNIILCCSCCSGKKRKYSSGMLFELGSSSCGLLPSQSRKKKGMKTLVLDMDETLIHSSPTPLKKPDFTFPLKVGRKIITIYVKKRPFVKEFLSIMTQYYEVVVFTASLSSYANPLLDQLDPRGYIDHRLFRRHCTAKEASFIKDLNRVGRNLKDLIIIDNSPSCFQFQKENGIHIKNFFFSSQDKELLRSIPFLIFMSGVDEIRDITDWFRKFKTNNYLEYFGLDGELRVLDKSIFIKGIIDFFESTYFRKDYKFLRKKIQTSRSSPVSGRRGQDSESRIKPTIFDPTFELIFQENFYLTRCMANVNNQQSEQTEGLADILRDDSIILEAQPLDLLTFSASMEMEESSSTDFPDSYI